MKPTIRRVLGELFEIAVWAAIFVVVVAVIAKLLICGTSYCGGAVF